jgi:hypothetical protein
MMKWWPVRPSLYSSDKSHWRIRTLTGRIVAKPPEIRNLDREMWWATI